MARQKGLGELERAVMAFLWAQGQATAAEVRTAVAKPRDLTDSTIRTVLRRLEAKDYVRRETGEGEFRYVAGRGPRRVAAEAVIEVLRNFCRGSVEELLAGMVDHKVVDSAELRRLAEKLDARRAERSKK